MKSKLSLLLPRRRFLDVLIIFGFSLLYNNCGDITGSGINSRNGSDSDNYSLYSYLYTVDSDGNNKKILREEFGIYSNPQYSVDLSKIVLQKIERKNFFDTAEEKQQIIIMNDTGNVIQLTEGFDPIVSPNSSHILFYRDVTNTYNNSHNIFIMDINGQNRFYLGEGREAQFSQDGSKLIYIDEVDYPTSSIYIANADGSNKKTLANGYNAVFTPDGSKIVFSKPIITQGYLIDHLFVIDSDGSNLTDIKQGSLPQISPNGDKIIYSKPNYDTNYTYKERDLYISNIDGTNTIMILRNVEYSNDSYRFLPDGSIVCGRGFSADYLLLDTLGNTLKVLSNSDGKIYLSGDFSPDGSKIIYCGDASNFNVLLMNINGSNRKYLTNDHEGTYIQPKFSPNGSKILFCKLSSKLLQP